MTPGEIALLLRIDTNDRVLRCCYCSAPFTNRPNFVMHENACTFAPLPEVTKPSEQFGGETGVCLSRIGKAVLVAPESADRA